MNTWVLRAIWMTLPVTAGQALGDAVAGWDAAPRATAGALMWAGWAAVLAATLLPRPLSMTIARTGAPVAVMISGWAAITGRPSAVAAIAALVATGAAAALATRGEFARVCAQAAAYGDEDRFPLKVPPGLTFALLPISILVIGAGIVAGPLLLADRRWVLGAIAAVAGLALAWSVGQLVHQLSKRWIVLVPAGLVVADPLTLTDAVLFPRDRVGGIGPADPRQRPPDGALDLRLGAAFGSCALLLTEDTPIQRRVRREGQSVVTNLLLFTPTAAHLLLERANARRIRVRRD